GQRADRGRPERVAGGGATTALRSSGGGRANPRAVRGVDPVTGPALTPRAEREQRTFRVLLDAMARPGSANRIPLHDSGGDFAAGISILEALADHEVTFATTGSAVDISEIALRQTGARRVDVSEAEYILTDGDALQQALSEARIGDIEQPDR